MSERAPGTPDDTSGLEVKEGILLDRDGSVLQQPVDATYSHGSQGPRIRIYRPTWPMALLFLLMLPLLLLAGVAIAAVVLAVVLVFSLVGGFLRLLR